ncbi:helix-turn-helix transcriptional regulator [Streptomyces sp. NPDC026673]|uniref:helix-turn-helix transcriptional regulator n=1 Tax=Streptomyces sp. NPDC026673 TaxID=3155724 RepID=UPI0034030EDE
MAEDLRLAHRLRRAEEAMDRDRARPADLDAVAAHAGCSRHHFVRSFGAVHGETPTPGRYPSRRRTEHAKAQG